MISNFNQTWTFLNLLLIILILIRVPKDNNGFMGVSDSVNVLGFSIRLQKNLDILIGIFVFLYFISIFNLN